MKIQTATDYVIQTYTPERGAVAYGYNITKTPTATGDQILVVCVSGNMFASGWAEQNARLAAYFIRYGDLPADAARRLRR
jgi:hypothetical protein